jgi:serine/threonine protein kinase
MEYADGGELKKWVKEKDGLDELRTRDIVRQLVEAMQTCHD